VWLGLKLWSVSGGVAVVCEWVWLPSLQRVNSKELPHYTGYLRKGLRTVSSKLIGEELRGFGLKVSGFFPCSSHVTLIM
jgi:hypothetical protein